MRRLRHRFAIGLLALLFGALPLPAQEDKKETPDKPKSKTAREIKGLEAIRLLFRTGKNAEVEQFIHVELWDDIRQPEAIHILGQLLMKQNKRDTAATWYRILMRIADEHPSPEAEKMRPHAEKFLKFGDVAHEKQAGEYLKQAGGKFPGAEKANDLWMTRVSADLHGLKALQAWSYIKGSPEVVRGDAMWIHTQKSTIHRSGMKYVDEVEGRKGVLFAVPHARIEENDDVPRPTRVTFAYPGKGKMLRLGTKQWGSAFRVEVTIGGKKVFEKLIDVTAWVDLSVELPAGLKKDEKITIELVLPKDTKHIHGVWLDYLDVFED